MPGRRDFDFIDHQLHISTLDGRAVAVPLQGQSVASFYDQTLQALAGLGVKTTIAIPRPFDLPDAARPFADDSEHASYDPAWARRYWVVLSQVNLLLEEFAARFSGKVSPVHHFWPGGFDWRRAGVVMDQPEPFERASP